MVVSDAAVGQAVRKTVERSSAARLHDDIDVGVVNRELGVEYTAEQSPTVAPDVDHRQTRTRMI